MKIKWPNSLYIGNATTLGADPEFFFAKDGHIIPAHAFGLPPKSMPLPAPYGRILRDGWAVEINPAPAGCRQVLAYNVANLINHLANTYSGVQVLPISTVDILREELMAAPEDVRQFGCDPAVDAYTGELTRPDLDGNVHLQRYAGGHMHISCGKDYYHKAIIPQMKPMDWADAKDKAYLFIRMLDRFVGLPLTYLVGSDKLRQRRQHYGRAGEFRFQSHPNSYGALEYRVPGPEIFGAPALISLAFGVMRAVYQNFDAFAQVYDPTEEREVVRAINGGISTDSLLDLVVENPLFYTKNLLKLAKPHFTKLMHNDLTEKTPLWHRPNGYPYGWGDWTHDVLGAALPGTQSHMYYLQPHHQAIF